MNVYSNWLKGLVAAPHSAMNDDCSLNLNAVSRQARKLVADGVAGAFICGSTGEGASLTTNERRQLAEEWRKASSGQPLKLIVHVGHNSLEEAKNLAAHAQECGADAIATMAPTFFKPANAAALVDFCAPIAAAAPSLPFFYYDIPSLTGVNLPMIEFLEQGVSRIPNLAGIKFTSSNFMSLQQCLAFDNGRLNVLFGCDEMLLGALALGVRGAVGSTYNYSAPLYHRVIKAFESGDLPAARRAQLESVRLVEILLKYGVLPAGKALMSLAGIECGPVRPPIPQLGPAQKASLFEEVRALGVLSSNTAGTLP
jgi:N-acetylneuraminate lyase